MRCRKVIAGWRASSAWRAAKGSIRWRGVPPFDCSRPSLGNAAWIHAAAIVPVGRTTACTREAALSAGHVATMRLGFHIEVQRVSATS